MTWQATSGSGAPTGIGPDAYAGAASQNPRGPETSFDPDEPGVPKRSDARGLVHVQ